MIDTDSLKDLTARVDAMDDFRFRRSRQVRRQMWFVVGGSLLGLLLLAYRSEASTDNFRTNARIVCEARHDQVAEFNSTRVAVGEAIVALTPDASESAKTEMRVMMLKSRILPLPDCSVL
jgi:hypothetical protein